MNWIKSVKQKILFSYVAWCDEFERRKQKKKQWEIKQNITCKICNLIKKRRRAVYNKIIYILIVLVNKRLLNICLKVINKDF
jgi:hypothetical protein